MYICVCVYIYMYQRCACVSSTSRLLGTTLGCVSNVFLCICIYIYIHISALPPASPASAAARRTRIYALSSSYFPDSGLFFLFPPSSYCHSILCYFFFLFPPLILLSFDSLLFFFSLFSLSFDSLFFFGEK